MRMIGLKKKVALNLGYQTRLKLVEENPRISKRRQCQLLSISRSSTYYGHGFTDDDLRIMRRIDEIYTKMPFYGSRKISRQLKNEGIWIGRKKTKKYMKIMWIEAIYPKRNTSYPRKENPIYPYLLKWLQISRPNQVWATDITYIRLKHWRVYLMAIIDRYSRYVVAWRISTTMDEELCIGCLEQALRSWAVPEIFNSDQWSQFTSPHFTSILISNGIRISMDHTWKYYDNIFVERLWRSVKYEEVFTKDYESPLEAKLGLERYFEIYNNERLHESLQYHTPAEVYHWKYSI